MLPDTPTLATVAERAGVSRQTVSNALNNPSLLRPDTLERVRAVITELGYSPNRAARNLRTRRAHLIGLRFDPAAEGTANALMDRFVHTLVDRSKDAGYHVLLFSGRPEDPVAGYDDLLRSGSVDAFVLTDTYFGNPQAMWLEENGAPFVAFGRPWEDPGARHPWVDVDGAEGIAQATRHLISRGHTRIAWLGQRKDSRIGEDRRRGWVETMHAHGLSTTSLAARGEDTVDFGRTATHELLDGQSPTALVCATDTVAVGAWQILYERGLRPGRDVAVTGFDDSQAARCCPRATSVRQPLEDIAVEVVQALGRLLAHRTVAEPGALLAPSLAVRRVLLSPCRGPRAPGAGSEGARPDVDGIVDLDPPVLGDEPFGQLGGNSIRSTASRSSRRSNRHPMSTGVRVHPRRDQKRSTSPAPGARG